MSLLTDRNTGRSPEHSRSHTGRGSSGTGADCVGTIFCAVVGLRHDRVGISRAAAGMAWYAAGRRTHISGGRCHAPIKSRPGPSHLVPTNPRSPTRKGGSDAMSQTPDDQDPPTARSGDLTLTLTLTLRRVCDTAVNLLVSRPERATRTAHRLPQRGSSCAAKIVAQQPIEVPLRSSGGGYSEQSCLARCARRSCRIAHPLGDARTRRW